MVLKQATVALRMAKLIRKVGISGQTFIRWKATDFGLKVVQGRRMKQLQEENPPLNQVAAEQTLDEA